MSSCAAASLGASSDMAALLQRAVEMLRPLALDHIVQLELDVAQRLPPLSIDPIQIEQVVVNLVVNAIDAVAAVPPQRRVVAVAGIPSDAGGVQVTVVDRGCGVPERVRKNLFNAFVSTKPQGLGMGLAICRRIVESHGGTIWLAPINHTGPHFTSCCLATVGKRGTNIAY